MIDVEDDQVFQTREPPQTPGRISSSHHFQARKALDNSIRVEDDERMTWGMHPVVPYRSSIRHDEDCDRGYRCAVGSAAGLRDDHHSDCRLPVSASFVLLPWTSELAFQHHESQVHIRSGSNLLSHTRQHSIRLKEDVDCHTPPVHAFHRLNAFWPRSSGLPQIRDYREARTLQSDRLGYSDRASWGLFDQDEPKRRSWRT